MSVNKLLLVLIGIMLLLPISYAVTFTGWINLTKQNNSVYVRDTWTYASITVDDTSFYVVNYTQQGSSSTLTFNWSNKTVAHNVVVNGDNFPYFYSETFDTKKIYMNLTGGLNATADIVVRDCDIESFTYTTPVYASSYVTSYTCTNNNLRFDLNYLSSGTTTVNLVYRDNRLGGSLTESALWALVTLAFIIGAFFFIYTGFVEGKFSSIIIGVIMSVIVVLLVGIIVNMLGVLL